MQAASGKIVFTIALALSLAAAAGAKAQEAKEPVWRTGISTIGELKRPRRKKPNGEEMKGARRR